MILKTNYKTLSAFLILTICCANTSNAQFWKKLKQKVQQKIENKVEKETDKKIDNLLDGKKKKKKKEEVKTASKNKDYGDFSISHNTKFGSVTIDELGKTKISKEGNKFQLSGSWWSHDADVHDGYVLILKNGISLEEINKKGKFLIPSEATLQLSYDPSLPNKATSNDGFKRAVTKEYQTYSITKGQVTINIQKDQKVDFSFNGEAELVTSVVENQDGNYTKTKVNSMVIGNLTTTDPEYLVTKTIKENKKTQNNTSITENDKNFLKNKLSPTVNIPSTFSFNKAIKVEITDERGDKYPIEFLLGNYPDIWGMSVAPKEMQGQGTMLMVMTPKASIGFMDVAGMKMKKATSLEQMGGQYNMDDKIPDGADFEYKKTGNTKTILGYTCQEYKVDYDYTNSKGSVSFWVTKEFPIQNIEMPLLGMKLNNPYLQGFVLELNSTHQGQNWVIQVTKVSDKSININTSAYKKMGF